MATVSLTTTRTSSVAAAPAVAHLQVRVGDSVDALRSDITWILEGPRRCLEVDLRALEARHTVTVVALIAATTARAEALGNELRVTNLPEHLRRDARGFGLRHT